MALREENPWPSLDNASCGIRIRLLTEYEKCYWGNWLTWHGSEEDEMAENDATRPFLITEIRLKNLLSFGPDTTPIPLGRLNILIGPNGSGKSNFLEIISLMRSLPIGQRGLEQGIMDLGGMIGLIWKGEPEADASIGFDFQSAYSNSKIGYGLAFRGWENYHTVTGELITTIHEHDPIERLVYRYYGGSKGAIITGNSPITEEIEVVSSESILSQLRDKRYYPILSELQDSLVRICFYRSWQFGRKSQLRFAERSDGRKDILSEDFSNLRMVLNRILAVPKTKSKFFSNLQNIYSGITDIHFDVVGTTIQLFLLEGDFAIPATRLSDGTLRFICLLVILLDPTPPPLVCLEEPELGMHPDLLPKIAELLIEASERTQLIVTTHSDIIVNALSDIPESVYVCEKHDGQTVIQRLNSEEVAPYLEHYKLGELWLTGGIGGTRW
jgi:predicted ATPase